MRRLRFANSLCVIQLEDMLAIVVRGQGSMEGRIPVDSGALYSSVTWPLGYIVHWGIDIVKGPTKRHGRAQCRTTSKGGKAWAILPPVAASCVQFCLIDPQGSCQNRFNDGRVCAYQLAIKYDLANNTFRHQVDGYTSLPPAPLPPETIGT
jgi:hypothetical protein